MKRGRVNGDPPLAHLPRGKNREQRKSARDGKTWTPTEQRKKDALMRQFLSRDGSQGNSEAYRRGYDAIRWGK